MGLAPPIPPVVHNDPVPATPELSNLKAIKGSQGSVDLNDKRIPICERERDILILSNNNNNNNNNSNKESESSLNQQQQQQQDLIEKEAKKYCFHRGKIDVTAFKEKLIRDEGKVWSTEEHKRSNVDLMRPSHDRWGIRKAVFVFCDDFMKRCYEFPWFQDEEWQSLLFPIFASIGVKPEKVVRCLLASMPPGIAIPVHHDTGYWVSHTHRIHVPIITDTDAINGKVIFRVGATNETLQRFAFGEGDIMELNNQAKHAVDNNWDQYRTHLIFDYVDDFPMERIKLEKGTQFSQTRRTLALKPTTTTTTTDQKEENGLHNNNNNNNNNNIPHFIIIGAQKSGTTSMYEYLTQHPLILKGKRRETHFFDWRWNATLMTKEEKIQWYHKFFHMPILKEHPDLMTGDSTPSYLLSSNIVIPRIKEICPDTKLIVMLRDPVARAYSHYRMVTDSNATPAQQKARGTKYKGKSFEECIELEIKELASMGITSNSTYEEFTENYLSQVPMNNGSHSILARGMYALQLQPWLKEFPREQLLIVRMEDMTSSDLTQDTVNKVFDLLEIPPWKLVDTEKRNSRDYDPITPEMKHRLETFYQPFNEKLYELLDSNFEWPIPSTSSTFS